MTRPPGERIKTDRRDALTLARLACSGDLVKVCLPDATDEAMRDLDCTREDEVRARQQLGALLTRHAYRYGGRVAWTAAHARWLSALQLPEPAQHIAFCEYLQAVEECDARVQRITEATRYHIDDLAPRHGPREAVLFARGLHAWRSPVRRVGGKILKHAWNRRETEE
jgi:transposase